MCIRLSFERIEHSWPQDISMLKQKDIYKKFSFCNFQIDIIWSKLCSSRFTLSGKQHGMLCAICCHLKARSLVISDLQLETKGSRFTSGC